MLKHVDRSVEKEAFDLQSQAETGPIADTQPGAHQCIVFAVAK